MGSILSHFEDWYIGQILFWVQRETMEGFYSINVKFINVFN